ncbi:MAG: serine hydrolase domain-containing protein [Cellvibrionaceae bacterium]
MKLIKWVLMIGVVAALGFTAVNHERLTRLYVAVTLFEEGNITGNFLNMDRAFHAREVTRAGPVFELPNSEVPLSLPQHFSVDSDQLSVDDFLAETGTNGLLILQNDEIKFEQYYQGHSAEGRHISWSMAKSFTSALLGVAVEEGHIDSILQSVTDYVPQLKGSGYDGVSIKDVMQMSSGVKFNEDYGDFYSDINRMGRIFAMNGALDDFIASLIREREPGTLNHYVSMDTQVLGMVLVAATNRSITDYMEEKLWHKLGVEQNAYWLIDSKGMEMAFGGLNASLRDYARFGRLYLNLGDWNGEQLVPRQWVLDSWTMDAPHLLPKEKSAETGLGWGYGYQWWIPSEGEYLAVGVYNQFIYIKPDQNLVIVKNSANPDYTEPNNLSNDQSLAFFRALAQQLLHKDDSVIAAAERHH